MTRRIPYTWEDALRMRRRTNPRVTQAQMAARLGISTGSVSEFEQGKKPLPKRDGVVLTADVYIDALTAILAERGDTLEGAA